MSESTITKRTVSLSVQVAETIDPIDAPKFRVLHRTGTIKRPKTTTAGTAHSGTVAGTITWALDSLTHSTGRLRDYTGKKLKSLTAFSTDEAADLDDLLTIEFRVNGFAWNFHLCPGAVFYQPFVVAVDVLAGDTIRLVTTGTWTVILEFE